MIKEKKYDECRREIDDALKKNPRDQVAEYSWAALEKARGNSKQAREMVDRLLYEHPGHAAGFSLRSVMLAQDGKFEDALNDSTLAIRYDDSAKSRHSRAIVYLGLHQYDKALEDCKTAISMHGLDDSPYYLRLNTGRAYLGLKQFKEALDYLNEAIAKAPANDVEALFYRAECYAQTKDFKKAQADLDQCLAKKPNEYRAKALKAALLSAEGNRPAARAAFAAVIKDSPYETVGEIVDLGPDVPSCADAALAALDAGKPQLAISLLKNVETHRPLDPPDQYALAVAQLKVGHKEMATKLLNECIAGDPAWADPRIALIKVYLGEGLAQKAKDVQTEGMSLPAMSAADKKALSSAM